MKRNSGFTLVESVMAMVLIAFAMVTLITFLYPQVERSASPHYQTRAANLGQSLMTQILARGFDDRSDFDGGYYRCGESGYDACTDSNDFGVIAGYERFPDQLDDVDDYKGCWWTDSINDCSGSGRQLKNIMEDSVPSEYEQYKRFTVNVDVDYVDSDFSIVSAVTNMKRVKITISTGRHGEFEFIGYRGNY